MAEGLLHLHAPPLRAVRPEMPNAPSLLGTMQSSTTPYCTGAISVAASTAGAMWVRFGVAYSLSSGSFGNVIVAATVAVRK